MRFSKNKVMPVMAAVLCAAILITSINTGVFANQRQVPAGSPYQGQINDINRQMQELDRQRQQLEGAIAGARDERAREAASRNSIEQQIRITRDEVNLLTQRIHYLELAVQAQEEEIALQQEEIDANHELFLARTRAQFVKDDTSTLGLVLGADSFVSFLTRTDNMVRIAEHDRRIGEVLIEQKNEMEIAQAVLEEQVAGLEADRRLVDERQRALNGQLEAANLRVNQADQREREFAAELAANRAMRERMQREMDEIFRRIEWSQNPYVGGQMAWPVPGHTRVSSEFGWRFGGRDFHTGIDIVGSSSGVINGATVVAANSGTVRVANWSHSPGRGFGIFVIIDHGGGVSTLYAHLSHISVTVGQVVNAGDPIGRVGSTGWSTGPHLHFEVRHDGRAVNPRPYIFR